MVDQVGVTHHVKIGDQHYLVKPGSYRKVNAPLFGSRFTTGDPDYNTLSFWQHWVQSCWVGGFGAPEWQDDSMYDEAVGVDTRYHELMVLTRDLGPSTDRGSGAQNWEVGPAGYGKEFFVWKNTLYLLNLGPTGSAPGGPSYLYRFNAATTTWVLTKTFNERVRSFCEWNGEMLFGDWGDTLNRMSGTPGAEAFATLDKPSGEGDVPYTMVVYQDRLYVAFGNVLWRLKDDWTWDGSTAFYTAPGVNYFNQAEVHLGFLYFASQNGKIYRTDGNNTFLMWEFEPGIGIVCLRSFDGRLFISALAGLEGVNTDPYEDGESQEAMIFQFSGSAVTELKRFGRVGRIVGVGQMRVVGGDLYFGAGDLLGFGDGGFGIGVYDPVEDAWHFVTTNRDGVTFAEGTDHVNWQADDIFYYDGWLWVSVRGHGVFRTAFTYRDMERELATYDTTAAGAAVGSENGGWITSSDFDAGTPGLLKLWNAITIEADLADASCTVYVEYSVDGGKTYSEAGTVSKTGSATRYKTTLKLRDGTSAVRAPRLKWRLTLRTTDSSYSPVVRGVHVQYLPLPEPNWQWHMTLVLSEEQELLDGTIQAVDVSAKLAALETIYRNQIPVYFQDVDGVEWVDEGGVDYPGVLMIGFDARLVHIGPTSDGDLEGEVAITLIESAEEYPA